MDKWGWIEPGCIHIPTEGLHLPPPRKFRDRKGPRRDSTFQSYFCFSSCMSLPPTLKARMSLLVLAYLSFSLFRSGES